MARKIYLRGGLGVGAFRRIYGGSKRNGSRPPHFCKSSGAIARHILQQLQTMKIVEIDPKGWVSLALILVHLLKNGNLWLNVWIIQTPKTIFSLLLELCIWKKRVPDVVHFIPSKVEGLFIGLNISKFFLSEKYDFNL